MRVCSYRMISLVALVAALSIVGGAGQATKTKPAAKAKPKQTATAMLFVVSQGPSEAFIDPIMAINKDRAAEPPAAGSKDFAAFESKYYKDGQKYRLLFGGAEAGAVVVKKSSDERSDCIGAQAGADLHMTGQTQSKIGGLVMGLATNSTLLGRRQISRRFPTATERTSVIELARQYYLKKGFRAASLENINTVNMTAMDLNEDGPAEIIATFSIKGAKPESRHFLFLIAEPQARGYKTAFARYERITAADLPGGGTLNDVDEYVLTEVLVDHLDVDRDGHGEIITANKSWEGITYRVYKKQKVEWKKVYEVYNYRCAF